MLLNTIKALYIEQLRESVHIIFGSLYLAAIEARIAKNTWNNMGVTVGKASNTTRFSKAFGQIELHRWMHFELKH